MKETVRWNRWSPRYHCAGLNIIGRSTRLASIAWRCISSCPPYLVLIASRLPVDPTVPSLKSPYLGHQGSPQLSYWYHFRRWMQSPRSGETRARGYVRVGRYSPRHNRLNSPTSLFLSRLGFGSVGNLCFSRECTDILWTRSSLG